jgi:hypothetical protein
LSVYLRHGSFAKLNTTETFGRKRCCSRASLSIGEFSPSKNFRFFASSTATGVSLSKMTLKCSIEYALFWASGGFVQLRDLTLFLKVA